MTYEEKVKRKRELIAKHNKELAALLAVCPFDTDMPNVLKFAKLWKPTNV